MGKDCVRDSQGQTKKGSGYVSKECVTYVNGDGEPVYGSEKKNGSTSFGYYKFILATRYTIIEKGKT